jgi:hypothetical protein
MGVLLSTSKGVDLPPECLDKDLGFNTSYFTEQKTRRTTSNLASLIKQQSRSLDRESCWSRL